MFVYVAPSCLNINKKKKTEMMMNTEVEIGPTIAALPPS